MSQCMQDQRTQNPNAADKDMRKTCHDQVKVQIAQIKQQEQESSPTPSPTSPSSSTPPYTQPPGAPMPR
jgi:hypothetical protein